MDFTQMKRFVADVTGLDTKLVHDIMSDMLMFLEDHGTETREFCGPSGKVTIKIVADETGDNWDVI